MTDLLGFDASNYDDLATLLANMPEAERVVVRCSLERDSLSAITRAQCAMVRDRGLGLDVYVWAYPMLDDPDALAGRAVALVGEYSPDIYWIDCEDTGNSYPDTARNAAWLQRAVAGFQLLGLRVGIYTGHWFWTSAQMGNTTNFSDLPLWNATDAKTPDRNIGWPYGGWQPPYPVVQYDLSGPDRDCFDGGLYENGDQDMAQITELQAQVADLSAQLLAKQSEASSLVDDTLTPVTAMLEAGLRLKGTKGWAQVASARESIRTNVGV